MERFALFSFDGLMLILRWLHLFFGVIWIGHLYYFNFVQGAFFAETDPSTKSNAIQKLVPRALWWFRWGAMYTFLTGLLYVGLKGHQGGFGIYETSWGLAILTGASLGTLMWANVWFIIWPNQKIVIASATQAAQGGKPLAHAAASANRASIASRTNTLFSIPMLFFMATASHLPLEISPEDQIVYEMHVRSFTKDPSSGIREKVRGTFAGIKEKIPYLKELGVNAIELMPIYEFDEFENSRPNPETGELLLNYWGYSTVGFFAPKAGYAATGKLGMQGDEFKALVKELHKNGIEVILDVVFNHTAEGNENGPYISYRGIDNKTYYMLTPEGYYFNFSGTGNTLNCNNPVVRGMVLDCLRYWASEYHIDGFRFDLAAILGRDPLGYPLANPPLLESLAFDPILAKCKLIAEAWDAGGLYQVGSFPAYGRWAEWNGKYRDTIRKFLKGDTSVGAVAQRLMGSPDLYAPSGRVPATSINFISCHDGFTLMDIVSYNYKHNEANGENNNDGGNDNDSWNCGWEGSTDDIGINTLRHRQIKNAIAMLMVSQGVPMILMGDEVGRTKFGNNNTYCHDNHLNWLDWSLFDKNPDLFQFFKNCIAFRKAHPVLRNPNHFQNRDYVGSGYPDISWHGTKAWFADWSSNHTIAFLLCGKHAKQGQVEDNYIYVAMNMHWETHWFEIPGAPAGKQWKIFANTGANSPEDSWSPGNEPILENQSGLLLRDRSVVILVA